MKTKLSAMALVHNDVYIIYENNLYKAKVIKENGSSTTCEFYYQGDKIQKKINNKNLAFENERVQILRKFDGKVYFNKVKDEKYADHSHPAFGNSDDFISVNIHFMDLF